MTLARSILDDLSSEAELTKKLLAAVPADKADWKPHEESMSLKQLAGHIAETPSWTGAILEEEMDFDSMMGDWKPYECADPAELVATLEKNVAGVDEALAGRDDDFLRAEWTMRKGEQVLMRSPRHEVIRSIILRHTVHHRGQLTVYLRLLDVPVPATYGSTADESTF